MSTFMEGDRVEVIETNGAGVKVGMTGTVVNTEDGAGAGMVGVLPDGHILTSWLSGSWLAKIDPLEEGDRVYYHGEIYEVIYRTRPGYYPAPPYYALRHPSGKHVGAVHAKKLTRAPEKARGTYSASDMPMVGDRVQVAECGHRLYGAEFGDRECKPGDIGTVIGIRHASRGTVRVMFDGRATYSVLDADSLSPLVSGGAGASLIVDGAIEFRAEKPKTEPVEEYLDRAVAVLMRRYPAVAAKPADVIALADLMHTQGLLDER